MRELFGAIVALGMLTYLIVAFIRESGITGRKKLLNSEKATPGAVIEKVEPVIFGSKRTKHYELLVTFSDGTSYRDKCNITTTGYMEYSIKPDQDKVNGIIADALAAHEKALGQQ